MNVQKKQKGFTIIEVVLVLAIAGLIFSMVFIALPALQRSQRDTQRKNDLNRALTAINSYTSNNRGVLPTNFATFETNYLTVGSDTFVDPSGANIDQTGTTGDYYVLVSNSSAMSSDFNNKTGTATQNVIYYAVGYVCSPTDSSTVTTTGGGSRKIALRMYLEGGGVHCLSN